MRDPSEETIRVVPTAMQFGYMRTPADDDAIAIYFETAALGSFAFLISPEAGPLVIAELNRVVDNLDDFRQRYREKYEGQS
jgi:hypothetical protein